MNLVIPAYAGIQGRSVCVQGVTKQASSRTLHILRLYGLGMNQYYVYILASRRHGTLYVGVTGDVIRRVWEHKLGEGRGFTARYGVKVLVHVEVFGSAREAIAREKQLKNWRRAWKIALIEGHNLDWRDLYPDLLA